eukprot:PLAT442.1.p4 GENE.PLAT442.1~~PLAT442.1.p4  ORF type:complete len:116 (+),score=29.22 PLAT442.1:244-591(+)
MLLHPVQHAARPYQQRATPAAQQSLGAPLPAPRKAAALQQEEAALRQTVLQGVRLHCPRLLLASLAACHAEEADRQALAQRQRRVEVALPAASAAERRLRRAEGEQVWMPREHEE